MLVARRDPPFHGGAHDAVQASSAPHPAPRMSRLTRFVNVIQLVGSLLAVPVGIASAYSFYRANFSPETTCQNLRSGIVAMLDKSVDASTRRILVRRDVESFEKSCSEVDPDATAAFKALLAADKTPTSAAPVVTKVERSEPAPKEAVRKVEPRPQVAAKPPVMTVAPGVAESPRRDPAVSDTQWLDAVRQALVTHKQELPAIEAAKPSAMTPPPAESAKPLVITPPGVEPARPQTATAPAARPVPHETTTPHETEMSSTSAVTPPSAAPAAAPALPPAIAVAPPPVQRVDVDHPVPPGSIPEAMPPAESEPSPASAEAAKPDDHGRSRIGKWISAIPLLGPVVDNARH